MMATTRAAKSRHMLYALIACWAFSGGTALGIIQKHPDLHGREGNMMMEVDSAGKLMVSHNEGPQFHVDTAEHAEGELLDMGTKSGCPANHDDDDDDDDDDHDGENDDDDKGDNEDDEDGDHDGDDDDDDKCDRKCGKPVACTIKINKDHVTKIVFSGTAELRISKVCPEIPQAELLVQPMTPNSECPTSLLSKSLEISVKANMSSMLKFTFVKTGTYMPIEIGSFYISVLDVGAHKRIMTTGYFSYTIMEHSAVKAGTWEKKTLFTSDHMHADEVDCPMKLTESQEKHAVTFLFKNTSSFELSVGMGAECQKNSRPPTGDRCFQRSVRGSSQACPLLRET